MDLPTHPLAGMRLAIKETLGTAEVDRVCVIGRVDPLTEEILAQFEMSGGTLEMLDCACGTTAFPMYSRSCAWIVPEVANYFHAYRLLHGIRAMSIRQRTPMLVLRPQLESAIARRDYYVGIPSVPQAWRHCSETCLVRGETIERASIKGGQRNGVMTAIEDFTQEVWDEGTALAYTCLPTIGGFCALFDVEADWAPELAYRLSRFHDSAAVAAMTEQELLDYLDIIGRARGGAGTSEE